ncbi:MAG: hypothetical protein KDA59_25495 [Planctomycetales bacterium]|nr:hypothetical protein [Planctomycetales bacterium]
MIFGIGLGRTGTRSLTKALRLMGLNAVHWDNVGAHVLDRWFDSELTLPSDLDAFIEGPFVRWWRAADRLYPDSLFILTTRDKSEWLDSVERWMGRWNPPIGDEWFNRRLFYWGTRRFHRELFSAAWDEHHEAIARYFQNRSDLLEINIAGTSDHDLWRTLGNFIGRPVPDSPFPHLNRSTK